MITTDEFRKVRSRITKECLKAVGFHSGPKNLFLRRTASQQLHSIQFVTGGRIYHKFAIDLGFHFACVPPYNERCCVAEPKDYYTGNCCFQMRLRKPDGVQFYEYGESVEQSEELLRGLIIRILDYFQRLEEMWSDGALLLDALPAEVMHEIDQACRLDNNDLDDSFARSSKAWNESRLHQLFSDWAPYITGTCVLLGHLALQHSRVDDAERYRQVVIESGDGYPRRAYRALKAAIKKSQR